MAKIVIYGRDIDASNRIHGMFEFAIDRYHMELTNAMETYHESLREMPNVGCLHGVVANLRQSIYRIPELWQHNEEVLRKILSSRVSTTIAITSTDTKAFITHNSIDPPSYNSVHQLLIHLTRDWARHTPLYSRILSYLQVYCVGDSRVLVPGAGLGRLGLEIAAAGHSVEMNECSSLMVAAFHSLSHILQTNQQFSIFPFLHFGTSDEWSFESRFQPITVPATDVSHIKEWLRQNSSRMVLQYADFLSTYADQVYYNHFDAIVTSFFIDTAADIFDYIAVIMHVLKPGGIWINAGPLHYHKKTAVPLSYSALCDTLKSLNFSQLTTEVFDTTYCGEEKLFMKPEYYRVPIDVWRLNSKSAEHSLEVSELWSKNRKHNVVDEKDPNFKLIFK